MTTSPMDSRTAESSDAGAGARSLSWRRLIQVSAVANLVLLLGVAAALGDAEAALIGVGFAIGLTLLNLRHGLPSRLLLLLLFIDVLAWMLLGAITNIANGGSLIAIAVPAALTSTSTVGLVATLAGWRQARGGTGPLMALGVAGSLFAVALLAGLFTSSGANATADVRVRSENVLFSPTALEAQSGQVTVELSNGDLFWHTFTIDELGVDLAVPVSGSRQATFDAPPGTYRFYCRIPGHETRMVGTLTVR